MGLSHSYLDHVALIGPIGSGKSTIAGYLLDGSIRFYPPTFHPQSDLIENGQVRIKKLIDFGGLYLGIKLWKDYLVEYADNMSGIVFCVDSSDQDSFEQAKRMLKDILAFEEVKHVPILILGTMSDKVKQHNLLNELEIDLETSDRPIKLFSTTIKDGNTIIDGFQAYLLWLGCCIGFCGLHRFYLDSVILGVIWFCTAGLLGFGQFIDLFLIPGMVDTCNSGQGTTTTTHVTNVTYVTQPVQQNV